MLVGSTLIPSNLFQKRMSGKRSQAEPARRSSLQGSQEKPASRKISWGPTYVRLRDDLE
ncbi:hypothetical protein PGTUg99_010906 [Puccinia graminis f. sp. tritici]|uniref:Uncharacterized protein n=1 Tax=Puccinia graminis f. sp. tritici TaxID=56615 RepID=A0A5B0M729_PUCGR|nr:hypothetical protein PGTUg99_010906 [Puccinia graminis f. sp. tritici]